MKRLLTILAVLCSTSLCVAQDVTVEVAVDKPAVVQAQQAQQAQQIQLAQPVQAVVGSPLYFARRRPVLRFFAPRVAAALALRDAVTPVPVAIAAPQRVIAVAPPQVVAVAPPAVIVQQPITTQQPIVVQQPVTVAAPVAVTTPAVQIRRGLFGRTRIYMY